MVLGLTLQSHCSICGGTADSGLLGSLEAGGIKGAGADNDLVVIGCCHRMSLPVDGEASAFHIAECNIARSAAGGDRLYVHVVNIPICIIACADMTEGYARTSWYTGHLNFILCVCRAIGGDIVDNRDKSTCIINIGHITQREGTCRCATGTVPEAHLQGVDGDIQFGQYNLVVLRAGADVRTEYITSAMRV